jgi:hypothetical protein
LRSTAVAEHNVIMRQLLAACFILPICATASAQVLDDDLEFENHVATIELDEDSPVLEGVGLSREITYECHFEGTLFLSVMADALIRICASRTRKARSSRRTMTRVVASTRS